jgi:hypothetical protein
MTNVRRSIPLAAAWLLSGSLIAACGGPIDIEKATYAGNCGSPVDVTDAVAASCGGDGCRCDKDCFAPSQDPAPGCAKDLQVTYSFEGSSKTMTCGPSQDERFVFVVSSAGEGTCEAGPCVLSGNACGPANAANGSCCTGFCDANGVCGL